MDGIGLFTFESFKKIVLAHSETKFIFIFDRVPQPEFLFAKNITAKTRVIIKFILGLCFIFLLKIINKRRGKKLIKGKKKNLISLLIFEKSYENIP